MAAVDEALENSDDDALWQFGTATLKGFVDELNNDDEKGLFEGMLDPDDPLLQTAEVAQLEGLLDPEDPLLRRKSSRQAEVDAALVNGDDLDQFGNRTLKAALAGRGLTALTARLDRDVADATKGRVPGMDPRPPIAHRTIERERTPQGAPPPPASQPFGNNTLRGFSAGAPPTGFPLRNGDHPSGGSPRTVRPATPASTRSVPPQPPSGKPPEWKITEDMLNQKWGSVLRELQPGTINLSGTPRGLLDGKVGSQHFGGSPRVGLPGDYHATVAARNGSPRYVAGQQPASCVPSAPAYGSNMELRATTPRSTAYRRMV